MTWNPSSQAEDHTDVSAEREFAQHLAFRLLDEAASALLEGRQGSIRLPALDPAFGAVVGQSMSIIAHAVRTDRLPAYFVREALQDLSPATVGDGKTAPKPTAPRPHNRRNYE